MAFRIVLVAQYSYHIIIINEALWNQLTASVLVTAQLFYTSFDRVHYVQIHLIAAMRVCMRHACICLCMSFVNNGESLDYNKTQVIPSMFRTKCDYT